MTQQDPGATMTLDEARAFVAQVEWTFAKTVEAQPHFYLIRARLEPELLGAFDAFVALIERDGYTGRFWQQTWRYLDLGDCWSYWPSQSWYGPDAGKASTMLNRRKLVDGQLHLEDAR